MSGFSHWTQASGSDISDNIVYSVYMNGSNAIVGSYNKGVYYSSNSGKTWAQTDLRRGWGMFFRYL